MEKRGGWEEKREGERGRKGESDWGRKEENDRESNVILSSCMIPGSRRWC